MQQKTSSNLSDSRQAILRERSMRNAVRRTQLTERAKDLLGRADFVINGSKVEVTGADPRTRLGKAFQEVIRSVYPNLRMLKADYKEAMIPRILEEQNDLISETLSEAEQEVLTHLQREKLKGERVAIENVLTHFRHGSYGWPDAATLCLVARLFRRHKAELKRGPEVLDQEEVASALCNSSHYGTVFVQIQEEFDAATVTALKNFHHDFFHIANPGSDAKSVSKALLKALTDEAAVLDTLIVQESTYPFVESLGAVRDRLRFIAGHDYNYPLRNLREFDSELLDAKEDFIDPIKNFVNGANGKSFLAIADFLRDQAGNLSPTDELVADLRAAVESTTPYRGGVMTKAIAALDEVKRLVASKLDEARRDAIAAIETREEKLKSDPKFAELKEAEAARVLELSTNVKGQISREGLLPVIGDLLRRYQEGGFSQQLALLTRPRTTYPTATKPGKEAPVKEPDPAFLPILHFVRDAAGDKVVLTSQSEVDAFVAELHEKMNAHVGEGRGITL